MEANNRKRGAQRLGEIFSSVAAKYGLTGSAARLEIENLWEKIAPPEWLAHTELGTIRHGRVEILVDCPIILHELDGYHKSELLEALKTRTKQTQVKKLVFRRM